jgi:hypothetical protein
MYIVCNTQNMRVARIENMRMFIHASYTQHVHAIHTPYHVYNIRIYIHSYTITCTHLVLFKQVSSLHAALPSFLLLSCGTYILLKLSKPLGVHFLSTANLYTYVCTYV